MSPVELAQACLERIARLDQHFNAFITVLADSALEEARQAEREIKQGSHRGPLHGIPIAHKDLYYTRGVRTTAGSKVMADFVPDHDATVVRKLRTAGTVLLGKLNMHEFAAGGTNENPYYGNAHKPWHLDYFPGGSSGIKPTYGRVSRFGVVPLSWSLDHAGPMTRSAQDAALMLNAMAGFDRQDSATIERPIEDFTTGLELGVQGLRLGIPRTYFTADLQPEVERAWRAAIDILVGLGATPVDVDFNQLEDSVRTGQTIVRAEMTAFHHDWFTQRPDAYSPNMHTRFETGASLSALDYVGAQRARERVRDDLWSALDQADLLATPTMSTTALAIGSQSADMGSSAALAELTRFTYPFNLSGFPALSIPCGFDRLGLPIGLQLAAGPWQEALLLRVGHAYQQATDWHRRRPPEPSVSS